MIRLPQRSVTRFFIPLIDVLTLLFCIFLLMPAIQAGAEADSDAAKEPLALREENLKRREDEASKAEERLKGELSKLRQEVAREVLGNVAVRELEIDPSDGSLYYLDPERVNVPSQAKARAYIRLQRDRFPGRDLYFLIRYRRGPKIDKPTGDQLDEYDRWFAGEGHEFKEDTRKKEAPP